MRKKKLTQQQRIEDCEKAITSLYVLIQTLMDKLPKDDNKETKSNIKTSS
jgi:hypothetical protein